MGLFSAMRGPCAAFAVLAAIFATSVRANALGSVGVEAGIVQRRVTWVWPDSLRTGFGFGAHADLDLGSLFKLGPYYLHSRVGEHPETRIQTDQGDGWFAGATFNGVGLRTRFILPIPGSFKPYAQAGLGYTWVTYNYGTLGDRSGAFFEAPIGIGLAYELNQLVSFSFDASYRHGFWHHGRAYGDGGQGSTGTSFLLGVTLGI
jgi:hypothetical protein